jgi:hypothetical protein
MALCNYHNFRHYLSSCILFKNWRLDSVSIFKWNLLIWAQQKELVSGPCPNHTETDSFYGANLSRFHLKSETECSLRNVMFLNIEDMSMDNVKHCNSYVNILSSQAYVLNYAPEMCLHSCGLLEGTLYDVSND